MKIKIPRPSNSCDVAVNGHFYHWDARAGLDPEVVTDVEGFIRKKAYKHAGMARGAGLEVEDLVQEGVRGALLAAARFNPNAGVKYLTYAAWWIEGAMREACGHQLIRTPEGEPFVFVGSLDAPIGLENPGDGLTLGDLLHDDQPSPHERTAVAEGIARLRKALPKLSHNSQVVIIRHLGLYDAPQQPLHVIAEELQVTRQRAGQILGEALRNLKLELTG